MKKIISAIIILIMVLPLTYIYAVGDLNKRIKKGEAFHLNTGIDEVYIESSQDTMDTNSSKFTASDKARVFYKDMVHKTALNSRLTIDTANSYSGQWTLGVEEVKTIKEKARLNLAFDKQVLKFTIENNTRDGFVVAWKNKDNSITTTLTNGAQNFCMIPSTTTDGEFLVPYIIKFDMVNNEGGTARALVLDQLGPTSTTSQTIMIKTGGNDEKYNVILNGIGNAHASGPAIGNQKKTDSTITVSFSFDNAEALLFSGDYKTKNYLAFVDL